jgi:hypothetical protein
MQVAVCMNLSNLRVGLVGSSFQNGVKTLLPVSHFELFPLPDGTSNVVKIPAMSREASPLGNGKPDLE